MFPKALNINGNFGFDSYIAQDWKIWPVHFQPSWFVEISSLPSIDQCPIFHAPWKLKIMSILSSLYAVLWQLLQDPSQMFPVVFVCIDFLKRGFLKCPHYDYFFLYFILFDSSDTWKFVTSNKLYPIFYIKQHSLSHLKSWCYSASWYFLANLLFFGLAFTLHIVILSIHSLFSLALPI